jgi:hypothetical protein
MRKGLLSRRYVNNQAKVAFASPLPQTGLGEVENLLRIPSSGLLHAVV